MVNIKALLQSVETPDFEAKAAQGGLPGDFWETYSAFANTSGGTVVLGLKEESEGFTVLGIKFPARMRTNLFNALNDRGKVSVNLLRDSDVTEQEIDGKRLLVVRVPEAPRRAKPVYINNEPVNGTFRRLDRGDYRCSEEMMRRMWAETVDVRDAKILHGFSVDDLDPDSVAAYRSLFRTAAPDHVWQGQSDLELLTNLGGWRRDRESSEEGLTLAGLVMFGRERPILDALPRYQVDYREADPADRDVRWTYRHTVDGRWSPNLFEFYRRTIVRLTRDLAIPFRLQNLQRIDDSHVGEALREALVNALIHADHEASGGIVIVRSPHLLVFDNPGDIRVPVDQALAGGVSDCRNPSLQKMFRMIGLGEQAGSGLPKVRRAWEEQMWRAPDFWEDPEVYRTSLLLPMVSLLPESALQSLRELYGELRFAALSQDEVLAAVTACVEEQVTRSRLATMTSLHPVEIAAMLREMAAEGLLEQVQPRRGIYRLPRAVAPSPAMSGVSSSSSASSSSTSAGSSSTSGSGADEMWELLLRIAEPARQKRWVPRPTMRNIIVSLCRVRALRLHELSELMDRKPESLRQLYLIPLIEEGQLRYLYPGEPTHPHQAYVAGGDGRISTPGQE
jgi:ATP-dependent DNA helicase RecG